MATETKPHETHQAHAKAAPVHALVKEGDSLAAEIDKADEAFRKELAKLREKADELSAKAAAENLSSHDRLAFASAQTKVETALNYLDPDCIAVKPVPPPPPKPEKEAT